MNAHFEVTALFE